jgi:hypothetical protein
MERRSEKIGRCQEERKEERRSGEAVRGKKRERVRRSGRKERKIIEREERE